MSNIIYCALSIGFASLLLQPAHAVNLEQHCRTYAKQAVDQHRQNTKAQCGYTGTRWNYNEAGQRAWCMTVTTRISDAETQARQQLLDSCTPAKAPPLKPAQGALGLPISCIATGATPVKQLQSDFRYQRRNYSPVQPNGLIEYDFNKDKQPDYLFVELYNRTAARLVKCFSLQKKWQRQLTSLHFDPLGTGALGGSEYQMHLSNGLLHLDIQSFEHNAGSCSAQAKYRYNTQTKQFQVIHSTADCTPVYYGDEPYPMTPPSIPAL